MKRLRTLTRAAVGWFPLTGGGVLLIAAAAVALGVYGLGRSDLLLFSLGALGLALAALAALGVVAVAVPVWLAARRPGEEAAVEAECGRPAVTGFSTPTGWWVPWTAVSWRWVEPVAEVHPSRRRRRWHERVVPERRTEAERIVREFDVSDAFGVARIRFRVAHARRFRAVPHTGALEQVHVVQGLAGGDATTHPEGAAVGDRHDMRHYAPGDPIRFVLWKVFARSRDLVVRTPERAVSPIQQTIAYLVAGPGDEPAAGAARVVVRHGALGGDWTLGVDGVRGEARGVAEAMDAIVKSAATPPQEGATGLHRFLANAPGGTRRAVVFVPPSPGPWLARAVDAARVDAAGQASLDFVVCVDGIRAPRRGSRVARLLLAEPSAAGPEADRAALAEVVGALSRTRGRVLVVDRSAGQVVPASHLRALGLA